MVIERRRDELLRIECGDRAPTTINVLGFNGPVRTAVGLITGDYGGNLSDGDGYSWSEIALLRLLRSMRATGCGAILAMLPFAADDSTPEGAAVLGMLDHALYRPANHDFLKRRVDDEKSKMFAYLSHRITLVNHDANRQQRRQLDDRRVEHEAAKAALDAAIDDLGRMSAIDGAVFAGPEFAVYAAGCVIKGLPTPTSVVRALDARMTRTEPYLRRHGSRHNAAFSIAGSYPGAVAFVISEDGPVSCALSVDGQLTVWPVQLLET